MKKTFLKSVVTGVVGLTLVGGCAIYSKESAHKCSANGCKAKKETSSCSAKKEATSSCSAKKETKK